MRLKSRGLGRKELVMDFREYDVVAPRGPLGLIGPQHAPRPRGF